ncbi:uncharacterized protein JCM10292_006083 [Rhodotorula paludigena]|uniref:uncharacterized protein n=1 Tax=Rhodotorula paludigena TaxID=86838 RepID=UPI00317D3D62
MGLQHRDYLAVPSGPSNGKVFGCRRCRTHLSTTDQIESKNFNGQHGRAYLFTTVVNVTCGPAEDRPMTTGLHTVRDVMCAKCGETVGWKYDFAYEAAQKYKENKFILEKALFTEVQ